MRQKLSNFEVLNNVVQECENTSLELINIEYNGSQSTVHLKCKEHGVLKPKSYNNFVNSHTGCKDCGIESTKEKRKYKIQNKCTSSGLKFIGFVGGSYVNQNTKLILECSIHGQYDTTSYNNFVNSHTGCKNCGIESRKEKRKSSLHKVLENIQNECTSTGLKFIGFVGGSYVRWDTKLVLECPVHGQYDSTTYNGFVNEHCGCKDCSIESQKSPLSSVLENIQNECTSTGLKFIGFVSGSYINRFTKLILECPVHGQYDSTTYNSFVSNHRGCPSCAGHNQLYGYIQLILDKNIPVGIKYGIENTPNSRTAKQNRKSIFEVQRAKTFKYLTPEKCKAAEDECKKTFKGIFTKKEVGDGYTETTSVHDLELIIEIYKKHGAVEI